MSYPTYLIHFNKNHSSKNGQFVSGDGDGDGILDDHHNYSKNKQAQSSGAGGGGSRSLDDELGDQIDEMVKKYNSKPSTTTYKTKKTKKTKKKSTKKKSSGSRRKSSNKKIKTVSCDIVGAKNLVNGNSDNKVSNITNNEEITNLINNYIDTQIPFIQQLLGTGGINRSSGGNE